MQSRFAVRRGRAGTRRNDVVVKDTTGNNAISYAYSGNNQIGSLVLASATWTGGHVRFNYTLRGQPSLGYASGMIQAVDRWMSSAEVFGPTGQPLRQYAMTYEPMPLNASQQRLSAVSECSGSVCLAPTIFAWHPAATTGMQESRIGPLDSVAFRDIRSYKHADVDGDGRADIVWVDRSLGLQLSLSRPTENGLNFSAPRSITTIECEMVGSGCAVPEKGGYSATWSVIDANADGRDDLLIYKSGIWQIWHSDGQTFVNGGTTVPNSGSPLQGQVPRAILADFDGDGLPDLITHMTSFSTPRAWLLKPDPRGGTGYAFQGPYPVGVASGSFCAFGALLSFHGERSQAIDLNRDGLAVLTQ